jgi:hypothetical protein
LEPEAGFRAERIQQPCEEWADLHELLDLSGTTIYESRRYLANEFNPSFELAFQGITEMTNAQLASIGIFLWI